MTVEVSHGMPCVMHPFLSDVDHETGARPPS